MKHATVIKTIWGQATVKRTDDGLHLEDGSHGGYCQSKMPGMPRVLLPEHCPLGNYHDIVDFLREHDGDPDPLEDIF